MSSVLKDFLSGGHQFISDGLVLMIVGGLGVYMRAVPETIWVWLVGQTTMTMAVKDDDPAFVWVKEWFLEQTFLGRIRRVDLDTEVRENLPVLIPSEGRHWFWHRGRPFQVVCHRSEEAKGWSARRMEWLQFTTIGRRQDFLRRFVGEIVESHARAAAERASLYIRDDCWTKVRGYTPRSLESVILDRDEKDRLLKDIETFRSSQDRYRRLGVPYHRGYLFYGPPGTGKTSLVSALAARFGLSIYAVSLTDFNDRSLMNAIHDVPPNSLILFEDIDCVTTGKARPDSDASAKSQARGSFAEGADPSDRLGVTLSGLLNVLDGFYAPENVLFVMTTNRIEALDRALLRPGRIDYRLFLGSATEGQKTYLFRRFFPSASLSEARKFVARHSSELTMAEFQGLLLSMDQEPSREIVDLDEADLPVTSSGEKS
jgi:chaperone BCS1